MNYINSIISNCKPNTPIVSLNSTGIGTVTINVNVPFTDVNENKNHRFIFNTTNDFTDPQLQYYVDFSYNRNIYIITTSTGDINGGYNLLSDGTPYYFVFTYTNDNITYSDYSSTVIATPTLLPPTNLFAIPGNESVIINLTQTTFVGSSIITNYYYSLNGAPAYTNANLTFSNYNSSCIITGLTNGTNYNMTLKAYNGSYSVASSPINFIPVLPAPVTGSVNPD